MRAAVFLGIGHPVSIEEVTPGEPGPGDVVVEVGASGVCHSDLSVVRGYVPMPPGLILGHEGAGRVVEVGAEVTTVRPGDRVIASFVPACGTCWFCAHEQSHLCERESELILVPRGRRADGSPYWCMTGLGTFGETFTTSEHAVVRVESDLPDVELALIGCGVTTGVGAALNTARVTPGASVAVIGCGGVGQAVIQGARIAGAERIIAIDPVALKRMRAGELGASDAVDPAAGDVVAQVKELTSGRGVDFAFEVVGTPETIVQAYDMTRRGGTVCVVGMNRLDAVFSLPAFNFFYEGKTLLGCKYGSAQVRRDFQRFVGLIESGSLDTRAMVSRTIDLGDVHDAFRAMEAGEVIRSVITR